MNKVVAAFHSQRNTQYSLGEIEAVAKRFAWMTTDVLYAVCTIAAATNRSLDSVAEMIHLARRVPGTKGYHDVVAEEAKAMSHGQGVDIDMKHYLQLRTDSARLDKLERMAKATPYHVGVVATLRGIIVSDMRARMGAVPCAHSDIRDAIDAVKEGEDA